MEIFSKIRKERAERHENQLFWSAYKFPLELLRLAGVELPELHLSLEAFDQFYVDKYIVIKEYLLHSVLKTNLYLYK